MLHNNNNKKQRKSFKAKKPLHIDRTLIRLPSLEKHMKNIN